ncbi:MAG: Asp-tRNA(Asn)/Glu-tRNA(Gln) amidotransferase subunit GatB [Candidatus Aenigmarchaeota archaeon]|nr:Asp-tRNA(Asn)/Glu-tRNA(Gln) amidotransferase subunit GatB [Candidatus Aenigmarchaeota archaeon]
MKVVMGLELHVHLLSKSKLFCSCPTNYENKEPNTLVCPVCCGFPGSKPKITKKVLDSGIMVAKALNCNISPVIFFSRKSYPYPDMPKNFQISQYEIPLAFNGYLEITNKKVRIKRVHLEEDPAKLVHVGGDITSAKYVLVDYNRAGIPLIEIVTEPDFESTKEVREFLSKLTSILEHLGVYDASKEAALRVDTNISLEGGERVEIKNITGFANIEKALNYEIVRQQNLLRMGMQVERETRHFDADTKITYSLRKKEFEEDYGYIMDSDLPWIEISDEWIKEIEKQMPELPDTRIKRFVKKYEIRERDAKVIVYVDKTLADFFESCMKIYKKPKMLAKWIVADLLKCLNYQGVTIRESKVKPKTFVELLKLIDEKKITERLAKEIIKEFVATGTSPKEIIKAKKLVRIEEKELLPIIKNVIKENKKAVEDFKAGKEKSLEFLIGQVLRKTKVRADPKIVRELIKRLI